MGDSVVFEQFNTIWDTEDYSDRQPGSENKQMQTLLLQLFLPQEKFRLWQIEIFLYCRSIPQQK